MLLHKAKKKRCLFAIITLLAIFNLTSYAQEGLTEKKKITRHREALSKNKLTLSEYFNAYFDENGICTAVGNDYEYKILDKNGYVKSTIKKIKKRSYIKILDGKEYKFEEIDKNFLSLDGRYLCTIKTITQQDTEYFNYDKKNSLSTSLSTVLYFKTIDDELLWQKRLPKKKEYNIITTYEGERTIVWGKDCLNIYDKNGKSIQDLEIYNIKDVKISPDGKTLGILMRENINDNFEKIVFFELENDSKLFEIKNNSCKSLEVGDKIYCNTVSFEFEEDKSILITNLTKKDVKHFSNDGKIIKIEKFE